jgi:hypothetical protein
MRVLPGLCLLLVSLLSSAIASTQQQDLFILLEDGTRKTYGDLRAMSGNKCCFPINFAFPVTYSSTNRLRLFIGTGCDPAFEVRPDCVCCVTDHCSCCRLC